MHRYNEAISSYDKAIERLKFKDDSSKNNEEFKNMMLDWLKNQATDSMMSFQGKADCLFELDRFEEAINNYGSLAL